MASRKVPLPPTDEQREISEYIEAQLDGFHVLVAAAERAINVLKERRSALVAAAVTGQIDVRTSVKTLEEAMA